MSNILKIFNPDSSKPSNSSDAPCFPCLFTSAAVMIAGGAYMASGTVFATKQGETLPKAATPAWRATVRIGGVGVLALGIYRGIDTLLLMRNDQKLE
jgi:hypothetical protein